MNLKTLWSQCDADAWGTLARRAGTTPKYLYQCAIEHRQPSTKLAQKLVAADSRLTLRALRPDVYGKAA